MATVHIRTVTVYISDMLSHQIGRGTGEITVELFAEVRWWLEAMHAADVLV